jgi:hypothetical protein
MEIMYIKEDEEVLGERFLGELIWVFFGFLVLEEDGLQWGVAGSYGKNCGTMVLDRKRVYIVPM